MLISYLLILVPLLAANFRHICLTSAKQLYSEVMYADDNDDMELFDIFDDSNISENPYPNHKKETNPLLLPRFAEPIANVTVTVGRDARLSCIVENLRGFKVAWVSVDTQTILTIHHNIITQNQRVSLIYNDHKVWSLNIRDVEESDRGWYMCQINTDPMRSRQGYLQVVVPPSIMDKETSSDLVIMESMNATLVCKAHGFPEPNIVWRREDGKDIRYNGENVNVVDGDNLLFMKVSRLHMGVYLCIASNGIPPSVSKRVHLRVQFPPMLSISNQLEGAYIGQNVKLQCHTEAYPTSINYWMNERGNMIISGDKYEVISMENDYNKYMVLKIRNVRREDFMSYKCVAKNSLGETDGVIKLEEYNEENNESTKEDDKKINYRNSVATISQLLCYQFVPIWLMIFVNR